MVKKIMRIGHRGASGYEPENTLASFRKALELNVDMVELDVHICKTGEIIVMHDEKVNRTTNGKGFISKKTLEELKKLDAGKGEKIPTLIEVLDLIGKKAKVNIELKGKGSAKPVLKIIKKYIKKGRPLNDFIVSSFDYRELQKFKDLNSKVKIGTLIEEVHSGYVELAEKLNAYSVSLSLEGINKKFVEDAHKRELKVFVYTVDKLKDIKRMKKMGVDGIFSNFPDRLL